MSNGVEVELAVARGDTYLHRVRFRPSTILTVGVNPMTTIRLEGEGIPDFLEFLNITGDGALLRFTPDIQVEVLSGSQVLATKALIDGGHARRTGDAYGVALEQGGKAVVRMGEYKLMLKIDPVSTADVVAVQVPAPEQASCGKCGTNLKLILAGGGALTPCGACGVLNRVTLAGTKQQQLEDQATRIAMPAGVLQEERKTDAIGDVRDPGSSTGRAVADLPTFDAISVLKDGEAGGADPAAVEALQQLEEARQARGPQKVSLSADADEAVDPGSSTGRAVADLPTFDAIAVMKEGAPEQPAQGPVNLHPGGEPEAAAAAQEETPAAAQETPPAAREAPADAPSPAVSAPDAAAAPAPAEATSAQEPGDADVPATGQWEETLTIAAVDGGKKKSVLPWVILTVLAALGLIALVAAIVIYKFWGTISSLF